MYRRMGVKKLMKEIDELKEWKKYREVLPEAFQKRYQRDSKLSDFDTKSEYERGFIDCWNLLMVHRF